MMIGKIDSLGEAVLTAEYLSENSTAPAGTVKVEARGNRAHYLDGEPRAFQFKREARRGFRDNPSAAFGGATAFPVLSGGKLQ